MKPRIKKSNLSYYPIQKRWGKLGPIFKSKESEAIWRPNMVDYLQQKASEHGFEYIDRPFYWPRCCDGCDWRCDHIGKMPAYWDFACHSACHWVVDMCLYVAITAHPEFQWRIVSSHKHSTVWNGCRELPVLFDVNFLALKVSVKEAWNLAIKGRVLKPGKWLHPWNAPRQFLDPTLKIPDTSGD